MTTGCFALKVHKEQESKLREHFVCINWQQYVSQQQFAGVAETRDLGQRSINGWKGKRENNRKKTKRTRKEKKKKRGNI